MEKQVVIKINDLFENIDKYWFKNKNHRLSKYKESVPSFFDSLQDGKVYTDEELMNTPYYKYIESRWVEKYGGPITKDGQASCLRKLKISILLFYDIKFNGLMHPLTLGRDRNGLHLIHGSRRIAILKALGVEEVPCVIIDELT